MRAYWFLILSVFLITGWPETLKAIQFDESVMEGKKLIARGVDEWDNQMLLNAHRLFESLPDSHGLKWLADHYLGYIDFSLSMYYRSLDKTDLNIRYLDEGIEHLYSSLNMEETFAESHALLALLAGQKALMDSSQRASLGMEAQTAISEARKLGYNNPRVTLISGIIYAYTPEQFGGSKIKALAEIKRAISLFDTQRPGNKTLPDWGHSEALAWQARLYVEAGKYELAKQSLEGALKINPRDRMALRIKMRLYNDQ